MKRRLALVLTAAMILSLAGCSGESNTENTQKGDIPQIKQAVNTVLSKNSYVGIKKAGENSFVVQETTGGMYTIIDAEGNKVLDDEFDYFNLDLEGDYYAVGKKITTEGENTSTQYEYFLYNGKDEVVFENTNYRDYHIYTYNNGILQLRRDFVSTENGKTSKTYHTVYLDANNSYAEISHISDNIDCPITFVGNYSNEYAPFVVSRLVTVNATARLFSLLDKSGEMHEITLSTGKIGFPYAACISSNGWMLLSAIDKQTVKSEGIYFYNIATQEEVAWPTGYDKWKSFYDGGYGMVFTTGNFVALSPEVKDNQDKAYDIFDLTTGQIVAKLGVADIELSTYDTGHMVIMKNSQYAYVNQNFEVVSDWYVAASDFANGYALIVDNGTVYAIDEEYNKKASITAGEAVAYLGGNYYSVKHDGEYYLLQVTPAN